MRRSATFVAVFCLIAAAATAVPETTAAAAPAPAPGPQPVNVYGDSVVYGGRAQIGAKLAAAGWAPSIVSFPGVDVGQISHNVMTARFMPPVVVLGVGYTYFWKPYILRRQIDRLLYALSVRGVQRVIWLNVRENRAERRDVNSAIQDAARRWRHIDVADWNSVSRGHGSAFEADGYHLLPAGGALMGDLMVQRLAMYRAGMPCSLGPSYGPRSMIRPAVAPMGTTRTARSSPFVGIASTATGHGYWIANRDGNIERYGDATAHGTLVGVRLRAPIVGMAGTRWGNGYWLVASDGGVFAFGDARFHGSAAGLRLNQPIVGMVGTPSGNGYWLVASDGGVFSYGDARFFGSTGAMVLTEPIVGIAPHPSGRGYWLVAWDGGIFTFGAARFHGSTGGQWRYWKIEGMAPTGDGNGYWLLAANGDILPFGDAPRPSAFPRAMNQLWVGIAPRRGTTPIVLGQGPA